jgi:hypothetical protein
VFEHHCIGPSSDSSGCVGHKFPGSKLPSAFTRKIGFREAEDAVWADYGGLADPSASGGVAVVLDASRTHGLLAFDFHSEVVPPTSKVYAVLRGNGPFELELSFSGNHRGLGTTRMGGTVFSGWTRFEIASVPEGTDWVEIEAISGSIVLDALFVAPSADFASNVCDGWWNEGE